MDKDIVDSLEDLGYTGLLLDYDVLCTAVEGGLHSVEYTKLVEWLTTELFEVLKLDGHVRAVAEPDDAETFLLELSGFLRELSCPYNELTEGPVTQRLSTTRSRTFLLNYLTTELQAARMLFINKPHIIVKSTKAESSENPAAVQLKQMLMALGFPKPPDGITPFALFSKVETKIKDILSKIELAHLSRPLLKARLSDRQWESIEYISQALNLEYNLRRQMLVQRLEVTVQSFLWSDKAKKKEEQVQSLYSPVKGKLLCRGDVDLAFLLASREDLLKIEKTSGGNAREKTKCKINRILIGNVPDRGGRAYELEPPPPEMPVFQQRQQQPQPQRHGSSHGGHGHEDRHFKGNDRVKGGWSDGQSGRSGGQAGWGHSPASFGAPQQENPAAAFFGGGGFSYGTSGGEGMRRGGGFHQQPSYQQGDYHQVYQHTGNRHTAYQQTGHPHDAGYNNEYNQDRQGGYQQGRQDSVPRDNRGGGRGHSGGRGGRGRGGRR